MFKFVVNKKLRCKRFRGIGELLNKQRSVDKMSKGYSYPLLAEFKFLITMQNRTVEVL